MKRSAFVSSLLAGALLLSACGKSESGSSSSGDSDAKSDGGAVKAAWIYVGPTNDGGWTTAHDNGR
jgi:basic membrane protein A